jgi:hypothetical protein
VRAHPSTIHGAGDESGSRSTDGTAGFVVDLRGAHEDNDGRWLWTARPIRHIGYAAYDYPFELTAVLPLEFDGVVFIDHSSASCRLR